MDRKSRFFLEENGMSIYRSWLANERPGYEDKEMLHKASELFSYINESEPTTRDIGKRFGWHYNTAFEYVEALISSGVPIRKVSTPNSKGTGRPLTKYKIEV